MLVATAPTYERRSKHLKNIRMLENIREKRIESGPKTLGFGPSPFREYPRAIHVPCQVLRKNSHQSVTLEY